MRWLVAIVVTWGCQRPPSPPPEPPRAPPAPRAERGRTVVTSTTIESLDRIQFVGISEQLDPSSHPILDAIVSTLDGNPGILRVEVRAFGADGAPQWQQVIGARRAQVIVEYLVRHGVERGRLRARGVAQPPPGHDPQPSFEILERAP